MTKASREKRKDFSKVETTERKREDNDINENHEELTVCNGGQNREFVAAVYEPDQNAYIVKVEDIDQGNGEILTSFGHPSLLTMLLP